jgi:hypothetical protein
MVTTWTDNYNAGQSQILQKQVKEASISCAIDIQGEALASVTIPPAVPAAITQQEMHNRRSSLAYKILNGAASYIEPFSNTVAIQLDLYLSTDGLSVLKGAGDTAPSKVEIKNTISSVFNYLALDCKSV